MTKYRSYSDLYFDVISFETNVGVHLYAGKEYVSS